MRIFLIGAFQIYFTLCGSAQVNWQTYEYDISPSIFTLPGSLLVKQDVNVTVGVTGRFEINYFNNSIFFSDGNSTVKVESSMYPNMIIDAGGSSIQLKESDDVFSKKFRNDLLRRYRKDLYQNLSLNELLISSCKKCELSLGKDGKIIVADGKEFAAKLISIDENSVKLIDKDGMVYDLASGKFNSVSFKGERHQLLSELYAIFFNDYCERQKANINQWEKSFIGTDLDSLIGKLGSFNEMKNLPDGRILLSWTKEKYRHDISLYTRSSSTNSTTGSSYSNPYYNWESFRFGNIFYNSFYTNLERRYSLSQIQSASSRINGKVNTEDMAERVTILLNKTGKAERVLHDNIFKTPANGQPFNFLISD
jgi:hypothetical protein